MEAIHFLGFLEFFNFAKPLNSAEMRMFRWTRGKTRLDHIRNEDVEMDKREDQVGPHQK